MRKQKGRISAEMPFGKLADLSCQFRPVTARSSARVLPLCLRPAWNRSNAAKFSNAANCPPHVLASLTATF
jgi:hypothetical protein